MKQATRDEYERAKRLALAGIEAHKERTKLRESPTADTMVKAIQEKAARGEPPTEKEMAALAAAVAATNPPKRGRGRPKGAIDYPAKAAFAVAVEATKGCNFAPYRNNAIGRKLTLCDALAEAMNEAGYTSLSTYDAAAAEMKVRKKLLRIAERTVAAAQGRHILELADAMVPVIDRKRKTISVGITAEVLEAMKKDLKTGR